MFIQTEATPNPATLKFLPGRAVLATARSTCATPDAAAQSPLAERLFGIAGVTGVFFGSDFIAVTKDHGEWQQLKPAILGAVMEHFMSGAPILRGDQPAADGAAGRILRAEGRRHRRHHQGADRDAGAAGGRQRRRRHHLPRLQGRRRLSRHEGRLRGLPVVDRDAAPRHPEPACATIFPTWSKFARCPDGGQQTQTTEDRCCSIARYIASSVLCHPIHCPCGFLPSTPRSRPARPPCSTPGMPR